MEAVFMIFPWISFIAIVIINLTCVAAVNNYINNYLEYHSGRLILLPKPLWLFATLFGGLIIGSIFYLLHLSILNPFVFKKLK